MWLGGIEIAAFLSGTMFTGIVEESGRVIRFESTADAWSLVIAARTLLTGLSIGDSVAVDGCCLTASGFDATTVWFDVLEETRQRTHFSTLQPGIGVNLEGSLRAGGKLGGHFVTGHIDTTGTIEVLESRGRDHYLRIRVPPEQRHLLVTKGSVAVDGVSVTVAELDGDTFSVWLIPHTLAATTWREKRPGGTVNIEFDLLGKYVERLLSVRPA